MGVPSEMYTYGAQYWMIVPTVFCIVAFLNHIVLPVFYNNHISNCYEVRNLNIIPHLNSINMFVFFFIKYLEMRFCKFVRKTITAAFVIASYLILPIMIFIPSIAFSQVTGINLHIISAIVSCVCVFYTMIGGIKAVVWTDVVQAGIMVGSSILVLIVAVGKVGGLSTVIERAYNGGRLNFFNTDTDYEVRHTLWNTLLGYFVLWTGYLGLNQSCVQRIVSVPTIQHARRYIFSNF